MIQRFIIQGNPRGQGRPRATVRGRHASVYEAKEDTMYKENLAAQVVTQRQSFIKDGPIILSAKFYMPRPKAHYDSKGCIKARYQDIRPTGKPDLSNLIKAAEDGLNGIVWADDSLIVGYGDCGKYYADTEPHIVLEVSC
jgi:Holliday junction resolvase RusA-like endonuclease